MAPAASADSPASRPAAPLAPERQPAGTLPHPRPGERLVRLPDGSRVSNWSEVWREACEVAALCDMAKPYAEVVAVAGQRSGKDPEAAQRIAARLGALVSGELDRRKAPPDAAVDAEARAILALPDKPARRARLDEVEAAEGPLYRADVERAVRALWSASR